MTKQFLLLLQTILFFESLTAQVKLTLDWTAAEDSACVACGNDFPKVLPSVDQGAYIVGTGWSIGKYTNITTFKYTASGDLQWQKRFDTGEVELNVDGLTDPAGNLYVAGYSRSMAGFSINVLQKFTPDGQLLWLYKDPDTPAVYNQVRQLLQDKDHNLYLVSERSDFSAPNVNEYIQIYKLSPDSQLLWKKQISRNDLSYTYPLHVRILHDTIFVVAIGITAVDSMVHNALFRVSLSGDILETKLMAKIGATTTRIGNQGDINYAHGFRKYQLTKFSARGDSLWQYFRTPDGTISPPIDRLEHLAEDKNGNLYLVGTHNVAGNKMAFLLTKLDTGGQLLWERHLEFGNPDWGAEPADIFVDDQWIYVAGTLWKNGSSTGLLAIYSPEGVLADTATYVFPGNKENHLTSVAVEGNRILASGLSSNGTPSDGSSNHFITRQYRLDSVSVLRPVDPLGTLQLFPNPTSGKVQFKVPFSLTEPLNIIVTDASGRFVLSRSLSDLDTPVVDLGGLHGGMYYLKILSGAMSWTEKLILTPN